MRSAFPLSSAWTARDWEYRWRALPLFLSQGVILGGQLLAQGTLPLPVPGWAGATAVILAGLGTFARIWGTGQLSAQTMVSMNALDDRLVTTGVFGLVRNPLYLGDILIFTGYALLLNPWLAAPFAAYHVLRVLRLIAHEERLLQARWGRAFSAYCRAVPRLVPRLGRPPRAPVRWGEGLVSSSIWLGFTTGFIAVWVTGDLWALTTFETAGFVVAAYQFSRKPATPPAITGSNGASSI